MKIKLNKGLNLNKESITKLQESQLSSFKGGKVEESWTCIAASCVASCDTGSCNGSEEL